MRPKISIIVPVYNMSKYLSRCLDSLINQTLDEIEILVIDDCSTDNSYEIIKAYYERNDKIRLFKNKKNEGAGYIRNWGIKKSIGKYILFVDSDDWIELKACEILYSFAETNQLEILVGKYLIVNSKLENLTDGSITDEEIKVKTGVEFLKEEDFFTAVWDKLWLREFILENDLKNEEKKYSQDIPMVLEGLVKAKKVATIDFQFYFYYRNNIESTTMRKSTDKHIRDRLWAISYLIGMRIKWNETIGDKPFRVLLAKQIQPALANLRKNVTGNVRLKRELLEKVCYLAVETKREFFEIRSIPMYKKIIIRFSPILYLSLFSFIDYAKYGAWNNIVFRSNSE